MVFKLKLEIKVFLCTMRLKPWCLVVHICWWRWVVTV